MKYIVYQTTNLVNNKIYVGVHKTENPNTFDGYIGCGVNIKRPSTYYNPSTAFQYAVKKYGTKNFNRIILAIFDTEEEAYNLESQIVNKQFISRTDVYNSILGGKGFTKEFLSIPIYQFDLDGRLIYKWNSVVEAAEKIGVSDTAILNAKKFKGSCKNYFWSYTDSIDIKEYTHYSGRTCYKYDVNGKYIESYTSFKEAAVYNNVPMQSIQRAVKGGYKVNGFYYKDVLEENINNFEKINLNKITIYIYSLNGDFITKLHNKKEIKKFFNIKNTNGLLVAIRTKRQYHDYQISLEYFDKLPIYQDKRNKSKKVGQYTLDGILIEEFNSITQACKKFGTGVQKVLRGQSEQCKNFIFKYIN